MRESSNLVGINFIPSGIVSPDIVWDRQIIGGHSEHIGDDPCPSEIARLGDFQNVLILWHASPGGGSAGYASENTAVVPTLEAYGSERWHSLTTAHEIGHLLFDLNHSSPYPSIMPLTPWFALEENRLGCDELSNLGWPIHDRCVLGHLQTPVGSFTAIATNEYHSCGIRIDKSVECWGSNYIEPLSAPTGTFTSVTVGLFHSCGLREDGTLKCWGRNHHGQTEAPDGIFTSIAAGDHFTCGINARSTSHVGVMPHTGKEGRRQVHSSSCQLATAMLAR